MANATMVAPQTETPEMRQAREHAEQERRAARERGVQALKDQYDTIERRNAATNDRLSKVKPTPTQAECDLARLGLLDPWEPKEPDGSESEYDAREREARESLDDIKREREISERNERDMAASRPQGYQTRDMTAGDRERAERERAERQRKPASQS